MRKSKSKAQGVVDFGTSPHGLSAGLRDMSQKTHGTESLLSLADGFEGSDNGRQAEQATSALPAKRSSGGGRSRAQPEAASEAGTPRRLPFHYLELTDEQCSYVAFALTCHIDELEQSHEAAHPEVQEALCGLHEALRKLERRPL